MLERRHRVFFALWPDADTAEHLHALALDLVKHARGGGRVTSPRNLHMTLGFCGSVSRATVDGLIEGANAIAGQAHEVHLDRLGFWSRGGVVYASPQGETPSCQRRLHADLMRLIQNVGTVRTHQNWVPHVTLARNVRGIDLPRLGSALRWRAETFVLAESHLHQGGARYEILQSWPLVDDEDDSE